MNTLWCFGDSFIDASSKENYHKDCWTIQLAQKLNATLKTFALGGSDLSYTYKCFNDHAADFMDNDTVIIVLTSIDRKWLIKDNPSNGLLIPSDPKEQNIIKHYRLYLDNNIIDYAYLDNFIFHVKYIANVKNLKLIIMHSFEDTVKYFTESDKFKDVTAVNYPLHNISLQEFTAEFLAKWTKIQPWPGECRPNHLIRSNHNILVDKILNYIKHDAKIDLRKGFITNIIDVNTEYNKEFCDSELFGRDWAFWKPA